MTAIPSTSTASSSKHPSPTHDDLRKKPTVRHTVAATLSASIEENHPAVFLSSFAKISDRHYLPTPQHLQTLLYLCLRPPSSLDPYYPISILHSLRSLHTPTELAGLIPRLAQTRGERENPSWLYWTSEHSRDASSLQRHVERTMRACIDKGIWELLWDLPPSKPPNGLERGIKEESDLSDEEEEVEVEKRISQAGWDILEWLIDVWEEDERSTTGAGKGSRCFLDQLPPPIVARSSSGGQQTNANQVMVVIRAAYSNTYNYPFKHPTRPMLAVRLLSLLFRCTLFPTPWFSPTAFTWSLLALLRILPPQSLNHLLTSLRSLPWTFRTHLLALLIEEIGGTRSAKTATRKSDPALDFGPVLADQREMGCEAYPPPQLSYVLEELLLLPPASASNGEADDERIGVVKVLLLEEIVKRYPNDPEWKIARQENYISSLNLSKEHTAQIERILESI